MEQTSGGEMEFAQLLRDQWNKFLTVRSNVIGMILVALFTVLPGLLIASTTSCEGPSGNSCPIVPQGPSGQAVEDRFYFVHQTLQGDGSITARLTSMTGIITYPPPDHDEIVSGLVPWAKAGIMVKEGIEQGSAYAAVMLTGSHGVRMQYNFTEDLPGQAGSISADSPRWLRLTRVGSRLTGFESYDGVSWTQIGTADLAGWSDSVQIGIFVTSPCDLTPSEGACRFTQATASFDQLELEGKVSGEWNQRDVGDTPEMTDWERYHRANGLIESDGTFTVTGTGDISPLVQGWAIERTLIGVFTGLIAVMIVAVRFAHAEYGLRRNQKLPGRSLREDKEMIAKAIMLGIVTFAVSLMAASVAVVAGKRILLSSGNSLLPAAPHTELRIVFGTALLLGFGAIFAFALGVSFRNRILSSLVAMLTTILPIAIYGSLPLPAAQVLLRLSPAAGFAVQQSIPEYPQVTGLYIPLAGFYPLAPWAGLAVFGGYSMLALGLAVLVLRRRAT